MKGGGGCVVEGEQMWNRKKIDPETPFISFTNGSLFIMLNPFLVNYSRRRAYILYNVHMAFSDPKKQPQKAPLTTDQPYVYVTELMGGGVTTLATTSIQQSLHHQ